MATTLTNTTTDTYRWDTVFALRVADVNRAIVEADRTPTQFDYTSTDGGHLQGEFDHWQMTSGGDGKQVVFALPIHNGNLNFNGKDHPLDGLTLLVALKLNYFEDTTRRATPCGGTFHDLKIDPQPDPDTGKVAHVQQVLFGSQPPSFVLNSLLPGLFDHWLNDHLALFDHIFATVNLNRQVANGQFAWLLPTATDYSFISTENPDDSLLGVLCNTQNRSLDALDAQLSANAIPGGAQAGFLISNERYLTQLLQPALPLAFDGLKATDVQLSTDQNSLVLINPEGIPVTFTVDAPQEDGTTQKQTLSGKIDELEITVESGYVQVYSRTQVDLGLGVVSFSKNTLRYQIVAKTKPNGKVTLNYVAADGAPPSDHWVEHTSPLEEIMVALVAIVIGVVLTVVTDGAGGVVGLLLIGLLTGLVAASPELLGLLGHDEAPEIDLLTFNATDPIVWAGQDRFQLTSAQINGCLQLGGTFVPAPAIPAIVHQNASFWP